jgi:hypothetical protein
MTAEDVSLNGKSLVENVVLVYHVYLPPSSFVNYFPSILFFIVSKMFDVIVWLRSDRLHRIWKIHPFILYKCVHVFVIMKLVLI